MPLAIIKHSHGFLHLWASAEQFSISQYNKLGRSVALGNAWAIFQWG